ncbi:hypothetical protein Salat_1171600 [Sesamum alatum]|uniref:Uncharacterized protein n=1 Tax=Sesamum alatum TaxID=300844 RepID=A0AAE2CNJ6_9LAMI|nr:hypothetical protein Salat_1171600 [Sesamum alatum]
MCPRRSACPRLWRRGGRGVGALRLLLELVLIALWDVNMKRRLGALRTSNDLEGGLSFVVRTTMDRGRELGGSPSWRLDSPNFATHRAVRDASSSKDFSFEVSNTFSANFTNSWK